MDTRFAHGFELAVGLDGAVQNRLPRGRCCISIRSGRICARSATAGQDRVGGVVERFDLGGDSDVFVGDFAVGDAGVDERHRQRFVAEQRAVHRVQHR